MDKKTKIDEFIRSGGRRELSLEEADQAVGGLFTLVDKDHCKVNGQIMTGKKSTEIMMASSEIFGVDAAVSSLKAITDGHWNPDEDALPEDTGNTAASMRSIMERFWSAQKVGTRL